MRDLEYYVVHVLVEIKITSQASSKPEYNIYTLGTPKFNE